MYRKNCDRCNRPSYSSSELGEWICPVCGYDLTDQPFFSAMTLEKVSRIYKNGYKKEPVKNEPSSNLWG
jgi:uncharacterized Zn finger protein (UPF0148 family)